MIETSPGVSPESHDAAKPRRKWSRYDAAHGARIRMILDGPEKGSWIAYCLDCDWTDDAPMPSMAAGYAAQQHEREADHYDSRPLDIYADSTSAE